MRMLVAEANWKMSAPIVGGAPSNVIDESADALSNAKSPIDVTVLGMLIVVTLVLRNARAPIDCRPVPRVTVDSGFPLNASSGIAVTLPGMVTDAREDMPLTHEASNDVVPGAKTTDVTGYGTAHPEQENADESTDVKPDPNVTDVRLKASMKAFGLMVVTLLGMVTEVRPESRNAFQPMVVSPAGRVTLVSEVSPENTLSDSVVTPEGTTTDVSAEVAKAAVPIDVTPVPNVTEVSPVP